MRDFEFNYQTLTDFSQSLPYKDIPEEFHPFFESLNKLKAQYHFPAVTNDVGSFLCLMMQFWKPQSIFEMGSGYGHSAFWYLLGEHKSKQDFIRQIILTEKRDDLEVEFSALDWPEAWLKKISYIQGDAFDAVENVEAVDLALIDGIKSDYLSFLNVISPKMKTGSIVVIDNSYWRGSFLDPDLSERKKSAKNIKELHDFIATTDEWSGTFIPYVDGMSLLVKK